MKQLLEKRPYIVFLLPLFFILHGFLEYTGFVRFTDLILPLLGLLSGSCLLFILFRLTLKDARKAGLMTLYCMGYFLFFGAIFDFLKAHSPWKFTYKWSVLTVSFLLSGLLLFTFLWRSRKDFARATFFVNLLFIIFILTDIAGYAIRQFSGEQDQTDMAERIPEQKARPDIYLILFDAYTSSSALKEWLDYDNSAMDSFLVKKGFYITPNSKSNYDATAFSMASLLNMGYLHWYKIRGRSLREDMIHCGTLIRNNKVIDFLDRNGYEIVNYSTFDLANHPSQVKQGFIAVNSKLILEETLLYRICDEFEWYFNQHAWMKKFLPVTSVIDIALESEINTKRTYLESARVSSKPKFVYSHFLIPHAPYLYDSNGTLQPVPPVLKGNSTIDSAAPYLKYLEYGNRQIRKIVDSIQYNTKNNAVILLMSDHGYRGSDNPSYAPVMFCSLNAVYLPDRQYEGWKHSPSHVNQFRVLFNTLFAQQYKLLPDSCHNTER